MLASRNAPVVNFTVTVMCNAVKDAIRKATYTKRQLFPQAISPIMTSFLWTKSGILGVLSMEETEEFLV
jgi:hypothetical protein